MKIRKKRRLLLALVMALAITPAAIWAANQITESTSSYAAENVTYSIAFNKNTTDAVSNVPSTLSHTTTVDNSYEFTIPSTEPTRSGYTFIGWELSYGDGYTIIAPGQTVSLPTAVDAAVFNNITLYAFWEENSIVGNEHYYQLSFAKNAPVDEVSNMPTIQAYVNSKTLSSYTATIPNNIPVRDGYTFVGWGTSDTATTPSYQPNDSIILQKTAADITVVRLYAIWQNNNNKNEEEIPAINDDDDDDTKDDENDDDNKDNKEATKDSEKEKEAETPAGPALSLSLETYEYGSDENLIITPAQNMGVPTSLKIDGVELSEEYYEIDEETGAIIISSEYLDTLKDGKHLLSITWKDGTVSTTIFITVGGTSLVAVPDTGNSTSEDSSFSTSIPFAFFIATIIASIIALYRHYHRVNFSE